MINYIHREKVLESGGFILQVEKEQLSFFEEENENETEVESEEVVLENEEEREVVIVEAVSENVQASDFQKEVVLPDIDNELPFEIGDVVHVVILCEETDDPESYYYLKDFVGKVGTIQRVIEYPNLQYEAVFGNRVACLYAREVRYGKA